MANITRKQALQIAYVALDYMNCEALHPEPLKDVDYIEAMEVVGKMIDQLSKPRAKTISKARKVNEGLAKKVYNLAGDVVTSKDVVNMGLPEILTTQKAIAVLRVGCELGLFVRGDGKKVAYAKVYEN